MRPVLIAALSLLLPLSALAEPPIPERRLDVSRNVDFYGADLQALFDTTEAACARVCLDDPDCGAFTFNTRNGACFPKEAVSERVPYEGAVSAVVIETGAEALLRAEARAADLGFLRQADLDAALEQARGIGRAHPGGPWTVDALLNAAEQARGEGDLVTARDWTGAALAKTDAADLWLEVSRLSRALAETGRDGRAAYAQEAFHAALNGYLRAGQGPQQASALLALARALEDIGRGREMIPTLRLAQAAAPRDEAAALLDEAIGKYGFRVVETRVESDQAAPRLCAEFSEPLVQAGVDYATYLRLPVAGLAVEAEGRQLCIDGVEHGQRYAVTLRAGLPAESGETLARDVELALYVRDRAPSVRFPGRGYVLPRVAEAGVPLETVNTETVELTLSRVSDRNILRTMQAELFARPLSYWQRQSFGADMAETVWEGTGEVASELNRDMTTRLPVADLVGALPPGLYALTAAIPDANPYDTPAATQWFLLSDLGLATMLGNDGLHVFVRGLSDAAPREGLEVSLLSRSNRVLATAETDAEGHATFAPALTRGTGGAAPALVTVADGADDMTFLSLTEPAFDLSDRGVEGREPAPPVDVFLATDRGAYRAGETIHATALARDGEARAVEGLPLTAILTRPDGVEYSRHLSGEDAAGGHVFALPLAPSAPRGTWTLELRADPDAAPLASRAILVEDFLPERIDVGLGLPETPIRPGDTVPLSVEARYLFGAPAAGLPVAGSVRVRPSDGLSGHPGYVFGLHDAPATAETAWLPEGTRTDAAGRATLAAELPAPDGPPRPYEAEAVVTVSEGSGRPVERRLTRALAPAGLVIGIRPGFEEVVPEGTEARFSLIALGPDLAPEEMAVRWTVNRVETRYQWYQMGGDWNWEPVTTRSRVATGEARLGEAPAEVAVPVEWGRYEILVERLGGDYVASSLGFDAGWYAPAGAAASPDMLEVSLDAESYRPGDTARLRLVPREAGKALVTVVSDRLIDMRALEVTEGETVVELPVTEDWGTGAYVTAQVIRPLDAEAKRNPARALGLAHAAVAPGPKRLSVEIDAPAEARPRAPLEAVVRVDGVAEGETAHVTLAAVDQGILNLTGFEPPDPEGHYFGQRRLGMEFRDVYGRLIDGMTGAMGELRSGGDAGASLETRGPPPTEELVAFFAGPLEVGPDGRAEARFDLPAFNGTVRLMAVAWSRTGVGQADAEVLVRDPVVVNAALPRFLAPGDTGRMLLEITHAAGPAGRMGLDVTAQGVALDAASVPSGVALEEGGTARLELPVTAAAPGDHAIRVALTTPDGRQLVKEVPIGVRVNDPAVSETRRLSLDPGSELALDDALFAGLRPGTGEAMVSADPFARFDAPGLLAALDRYPYGCTEQVTSQALPLLYLSELGEAMGLGTARDLDARIDGAIRLVLTRQAANGAFGLWRAGSGDFWLDAYVTDFLSRARAEGHEVPDTAFRAALDNLRNRVNYAPDFDSGGEDIAYALMVLAREGAAAMGDLRYYADVKADAFATPLAQAQLGAALASYGDQTRADAMFARAVSRLGAAPDRGWRDDYGTALRDTAAVLTLASAAGSEAVDRAALAGRIAAAEGRLSTQEQAWMLLAAHQMAQDPALIGLELDGVPVEGPLLRRMAEGEALGLRNSGDAPVNVTVTTFGVPEGTVTATGYGYALSRNYYTLDGAPASFPVAAGTRLVAVLDVRPAEAQGARLMVDDPLPAGLEIDNPNLLRSGDIAGLGWLETAEARHAEFRADRFLAQVDWQGAEPFRLAYIVRAVRPGDYHHPAALVEDMYRPEYRATTASGRIAVTE